MIKMYEDLFPIIAETICAPYRPKFLKVGSARKTGNNAGRIVSYWLFPKFWPLEGKMSYFYLLIIFYTKNKAKFSVKTLVCQISAKI